MNRNQCNRENRISFSKCTDIRPIFLNGSNLNSDSASKMNHHQCNRMSFFKCTESTEIITNEIQRIIFFIFLSEYSSTIMKETYSEMIQNHQDSF